MLMYTLASAEAEAAKVAFRFKAPVHWAKVPDAQKEHSQRYRAKLATEENAQVPGPLLLKRSIIVITDAVTVRVGLTTASTNAQNVQIRARH